MTQEPLFKAAGLTKVFGHKKNEVVAVNDVSFDVRENEIVSFVGQSGSGKTTIARMLMGLLRPTSGKIYYRGRDINLFSREEKKAYWRNVQGIFQDPYESFNQFFPVEKTLHNCFSLYDEPVPQKERLERICEALESVGLDPDNVLGKYPFELSGGQRQRIMIARTFLLHPTVLIADEPTSMIDACSRANILNVLMDIKSKQNTSIVFITHDMGFAYYASDRLYIMEQGRIVESGNVERVVHNPSHPYTKRLLSDVPLLHREWI
ncbi:MAG: ABC transporter ATP-binding protein [Limnochordia bacterium]